VRRVLGQPPAFWVAVLCLAAFALRLAALFLLNTTASANDLSVWMWGREPGCLADALARGAGFSDPFGRDTGPSGWLTPVYPALLAGLMRLCDGLNSSTALWLFVVQAAASAVTCALLWRFGRVLNAERVGLLAALAFAFYPTAIWNSVNKVWDTSFVAAALLWFLVLLVESGRTPSRRRCLTLGLAYGALLMLNPAPLGILPAVLLYLAQRSNLSESIVRCSLLCAAALAVCAPWMIRNQVMLGTPGLRSNLGIELYVGNNDVANGRHQTPYHPSQTWSETNRLKAAGGEVAYARIVGREALEWIERNPRRFAGLTLRRVQIFWVGESPNVDPRVSNGVKAADDPNAWIKWPLHLATGLCALVAAILFRGRRETWLVRGVLLLFPLPYYLTHVAERYRFPIDPLLVFLGVWLACLLVDRVRGSAHPGSSEPDL